MLTIGWRAGAQSVLVGLSALAMVLRAVDRVPVLWHGASLMVRALSLAIVGVHVFLEVRCAPCARGAGTPIDLVNCASYVLVWRRTIRVASGQNHCVPTVAPLPQAAICQSEESEAVRAAYGLMAAAALA